MSLKAEIAAEAKRLGFNLFGVTTPEPPTHFEVYESWLEKGGHGDMGYLETVRARERRRDPGLILSGCQSILVLGWPHAIPNLTVQAQDEVSPAQPKGRIAAYAWGEDYHDVIPARLELLVSFIEARVGVPVPNRWYTDTGPILERDLAMRAGLGWIGKNTCLINPQQGSFTLLAELFLGIKIEPDQPFDTDRCGSCTRCIEACPTACIQTDRTIDSSQCISYLTIELKGAIPQELRPQLGDWVFGCDICQQVCPWNQRFASPSRLSLEETQKAEPHLIKELSLSPQGFNQKFKGSSVRRAKRRGYLRNVAVALGNSSSPQAIPALIDSLSNDIEPLVRSHAAWALGRIATHQARQALLKTLDTEQDPLVLEEIHLSLGD